jgi:hypothetical protein
MLFFIREPTFGYKHEESAFDMLNLDQQMRMRQREIDKVLEAAIKKNAQAATACAVEGVRRTKVVLSNAGRAAPNDPPALKTGFLRDSVVSVPAKPGNPTRAAFGANAPYASAVEFGHGGIRPAGPHPFIRRVAWDPDFHDFITNTVAQNWKKSIKKGVAKFKNLGIK